MMEYDDDDDDMISRYLERNFCCFDYINYFLDRGFLSDLQMKLYRIFGRISSVRKLLIS